MKSSSDRSKTALAEPAPVASPATSDHPRGTIAEWTITILLLLFGTTTLVQAFVIPTGSMEDTLLIGDHLLVDKLAYAPSGKFSKYILPYAEPKHGDIIVFRYPVDISQTFVKRTIGVPGDRIKIINQQIYRNGVKLNEPYVYHKNPYPDSYRDNFPGVEPNLLMLMDQAKEMLANNVVNGEVVVPKDSFFAMGDNRDNSQDSRVMSDVGYIPAENLIGRAEFLFFSTDGTAGWLEPWKWFSAIRYDRLFQAVR